MIHLIALHKSKVDDGIKHLLKYVFFMCYHFSIIKETISKINVCHLNTEIPCFNEFIFLLTTQLHISYF